MAKEPQDGTRAARPAPNDVAVVLGATAAPTGRLRLSVAGHTERLQHEWGNGEAVAWFDIPQAAPDDPPTAVAAPAQPA
jgi:hypothetical protein